MSLLTCTQGKSRLNGLHVTLQAMANLTKPPFMWLRVYISPHIHSGRNTIIHLEKMFISTRDNKSSHDIKM